MGAQQPLIREHGTRPDGVYSIRRCQMAALTERRRWCDARAAHMQNPLAQHIPTWYATFPTHQTNNPEQNMMTSDTVMNSETPRIAIGKPKNSQPGVWAQSTGHDGVSCNPSSSKQRWHGKG